MVCNYIELYADYERLESPNNLKVFGIMHIIKTKTKLKQTFNITKNTLPSTIRVPITASKLMVLCSLYKNSRADFRETKASCKRTLVSFEAEA